MFPAPAAPPASSSATLGTAVVIGAGMAGLLAARVLADHAQAVVLVERDRLAGLGHQRRRGVPQGAHPHNLLASGLQVIEQLFPGFTAELRAAGAPEGGGAFYTAGGILEAPGSGGRGSVYASRGLLEGLLRERVRALAQVRVVDGVQAELIGDGAAGVRGVRLTTLDSHEAASPLPAQEVLADLVVDAQGRLSRTPSWLSAHGFASPEVERVEVHMRYATREFHRSAASRALMRDRGFFVVSPAPDQRRACGILAQEGDRWIVTLIGYFGDQPPLDADGFLAFARGLPVPEPGELIAQAEPASEIRGFAFAANTRVHYERLPRTPRGLLVMGDALAAFSPVYGQGMSVAALQAHALQRALQGGLSGLEARYFRAAARVVDTPWMLAAGGDRQMAPGGPHGSWLQRTRARWVRRVLRAGHHDARVAEAFVRVARLQASPATLLHPALVWRVWQSSWRTGAAQRQGGSTQHVERYTDTAGPAA